MDLVATYQAQYPGITLLRHEVTDATVAYLRERGWLQDGESVLALEKPGEGNMNFVARVVTNRRSFVVKQALPWVYKYPQVPAPLGRGQVEAAFYQLIEDDPVLHQFTPTLIGFDPQSHVLAQEDLGAGTDFLFLYSSDQEMTSTHLQRLLLFLSHLHQIKAGPEEGRALENRAMRELNHEHIFRYPFDEHNGLDLDAVLPGLQRVALPYQRDSALKQKIAGLGQQYLQDGDTLIHGDFYPGSWLRVASEVRVIDPEFGFFGRPEFDVGVMLAHALMTATATYSPEQVLARYQAPSGFDASLARAFAGVEVLRRFLGLAQLPLVLPLSSREALLDQAVRWL